MKNLYYVDAPRFSIDIRTGIPYKYDEFPFDVEFQKDMLMKSLPFGDTANSSPLLSIIELLITKLNENVCVYLYDLMLSDTRISKSGGVLIRCAFYKLESSI